MFDTIADDVIKIYEQLKDRYNLILTDTSELSDQFTAEGPIIIGEAHGQIIQLYEDGIMFVLGVMDAEQTKGTHWHPFETEDAIRDIARFMEGKSDYPMRPFG